MSCIGVWVSHVTYKWRHQGTIATPGEGGGEEEEDNDPPYAIAKTKVLRTPTKKGEGARRRAVKLPP